MHEIIDSLFVSARLDQQDILWGFLSAEKKHCLNPKFLSYLPNPSAQVGYGHKVNFFKRSLTGLNSEFSFS